MDIFKRKGQDAQTDPQSSDVDSYIDPSVFVEDSDPSVAEPATESKPSSRLDKFLRVDYEWYGFSDGYADPSADFMEKKLKAIRSDFRLELDRSLDEMRSRVSDARLHQIRISGMPGRMEEEIKEKVRQLESAIQELQRQKELSVDDEGMVSSAISRYTIGFTKGVNRYQQEKFLAGDTGMF